MKTKKVDFLINRDCHLNHKILLYVEQFLVSNNHPSTLKKLNNFPMPLFENVRIIIYIFSLVKSKKSITSTMLFRFAHITNNGDTINISLSLSHVKDQVRVRNNLSDAFESTDLTIQYDLEIEILKFHKIG